MGTLLVEICADGLASALAAGDGGADRVELCQHLEVGGVTPSAGIIAAARRRLAIPLHVLIRPRGGDFVPSPAEFEAMGHDIDTCKSLGADGVVLGVLLPGGSIDEERTSALADRARPMGVAFHRAFDASPDPIAMLDALIRIGIDRVLTSGLAPSARLGIETLAALARHAAGRLAILAGGQVSADDLPAIAGAGLREVHVGSAACRGGVTDAGLVRGLVGAARALA